MPVCIEIQIESMFCVHGVARKPQKAARMVVLLKHISDHDVFVLRFKSSPRLRTAPNPLSPQPPAWYD
jgi:hypothetical protein